MNTYKIERTQAITVEAASMEAAVDAATNAFWGGSEAVVEDWNIEDLT